ncbi:DUF3152 domain-containing protein [Streptomyces sp. NPDC059909]|uniref:DUF3152 domain-containing protein n=1 Tax=Streptomyces sp. NPDC059909 TaxID=3346998 RepID=UPI0036560757
MGRHSRKGPAPKAADGNRTQGTTSAVPASATTTSTAVTPSGTSTSTDTGSGRRRRSGPGPGPGDPEQRPGSAGYGTPAHGTPVYGTPAHGTPAYGTQGYGTPAHGTPAYGTPAYGTPAHGVPRVRGGHPEQREPGGGWGAAQSDSRYGDWQGTPNGRTATMTGQHPVVPPPARQGPPIGAGARIPGPRREFVEAFDDPEERQGPRTGTSSSLSRAEPFGADADADADADSDADPDAPAKPARGRTFTGIAAAAVTTVLVVVVAGQVTGTGSEATGTKAAGEADRGSEDGSASRSDNRLAPPQEAAPRVPAAPPTYAELMTRQFPLDPKLKGSGDFEAVPGFDRAPGKGRKIRYRIDVEKGLGLDSKLFAQAVQQTLNDDRSWAHNGAMTFERISSGEPEFVITLASPGTTATWCAKSGLDTTVDNVSCDSASTQRVMINAYRWAQGAETYGAKAMPAYRQMLINHEVGHRLGYGHVNCRTPGALAPVMQQQTKSLDISGIKCRPNPWVHPGDD